MAAKSNKEPKTSGKSVTKSTGEKPKKPLPKKQSEEDDDLEDDEDEITPKRVSAGTSSKKTKNEDDEDEDDIEEEDDWNKVEEDDAWDPDFEEFDLPKSKSSKGGSKKGADEEEDFKIDDEFKDLGLFNDAGFEEEDDF